DESRSAALTSAALLFRGLLIGGLLILRSVVARVFLRDARLEQRRGEASDLFSAPRAEDAARERAPRVAAPRDDPRAPDPRRRRRAEDDPCARSEMSAGAHAELLPADLAGAQLHRFVRDEDGDLACGDRHRGAILQAIDDVVADAAEQRHHMFRLGVRTPLL